MFRWFSNKPICRRRIILEQLEERIVLDAAVDSSAQQESCQDQADAPQDPGEASNTSAEAPGDQGAAGIESSDSLSQVYGQEPGDVLGSNALGDIAGVSDQSDAGNESDVRILVVSDGIAYADQLAQAVNDGTISVVYDSSSGDPATILSSIESALGGQEASSIALATHQAGQGAFHLVGDFTGNSDALMSDAELRSFWQALGDLVAEDGRVDLMACDLASSEEGIGLVKQLEELTSRQVAASDDETGNPEFGGDWVLETHGIDIGPVYFSESLLSDYEGVLSSNWLITYPLTDSNPQFGGSVAIDGDFAVIGACESNVFSHSDAGRAFFYHWNGQDWEYTEPVSLGSASQAGDQFGYAVSISGDYALIGANERTESNYARRFGIAYMYHWDGDTWGRVQSFYAADGYINSFADSVCVNGDYAIIGGEVAGEEDGLATPGMAYIYHLNGSHWDREAILSASDPHNYDSFGCSVSIDGDWAVVGADSDDVGSNTSQGSAYVFHKESGVWTQVAHLKASNGEAWDNFGCSVSIEGDMIVVGALHDNENNSGKGSVTIYRRSGSSWNVEDVIAGTSSSFGQSVDVSDGDIVVGSYSHTTVFRYDGAEWTGIETYSKTYTGESVSIDGPFFVSGSPSADGRGSVTFVGYENIPPYASDDGPPGGFTTNEDSPLTTGNVLANDVDANQGDSLSVLSYDDTGLIGALSYNNNGTFLYDPDGQFEELSQTEYATETFTYVVQDQWGGTDSAEVTIRIDGRNDAPTAGDDGPFSADEDHVYSGSGLLDNDYDIDSGDSVSVSWYSAQSNLGADIIAQADGTFTYDPTGSSQLQSLSKGKNVTDFFTYKAGDSYGALSAPAQVDLLVRGYNDAPEGQDFSVSGNEDNSVSLDFLGHLSDVDSDAVVQFQILAKPANGRVFFGGSEITYGAWYALSGGFSFAPDPDWNGTTSLQFRGRDQYDAQSGRNTVTINVEAAHDEPVAKDFSEHGAEDTVVTINDWIFDDTRDDVGASDADNPVSVTIRDLPSNGTLLYNGVAVSVGADIPWSDAIGGAAGDKVTFDPDTDWNGSTTFHYTVTDDGADHNRGTVQGEVTINVAAAHDEPVAKNFTEQGAEDTIVTINDWIFDDTRDDVGASGADNPVSVTIRDLPSNGTLLYNGVAVSVGADIPWSDAIGGATGDKVTFDPDTDWNGSTTFHYTVTDDGADHNRGTVQGEVTINVAAAHDEPVAKHFTEQGAEDTIVTINDWIFDDTRDDVGASDADNPVSVTIRDLPSNGTLLYNGVAVSAGADIPWADAIGGATGDKVTFDPDTDWNGSTTFHYTVNDDGADHNRGTVQGEVTINVAAVNDPPEIAAPDDVTLLEDTSIDITGISVSDVDVDEGDGKIEVTLEVNHGDLTLASTNGLVFDPSGGNGQSHITFIGALADVNDALLAVTYRPYPDYFGQDSLEIIANDLGNRGAGGPQGAEDSIDITVIGVPEFDEFGASYLDASGGRDDGSGSETGPFSTSGSIPAIGNLLELLSSEGLLPFSLSADRWWATGSSSEASQFGKLLYGGLFGATEETQDLAWSSLLSFVSGNKAESGEEWLGLEDFLARLGDWRIGKSPDEILLVFDVDDIKLAAWFDALLSAEGDALSDQRDAALTPEESTHQWLSARARVFDMDDPGIGDSFTGDFAHHCVLSGNHPTKGPDTSICRVFDLEQINFMDALAG